MRNSVVQGIALLMTVFGLVEADARTALGQRARAGGKDIVGFCARRGTVDYPDKAFFGSAYRQGRVPDQVGKVDGASKWRCMDGKVLLCQDSADGDWCSRKDPSKVPTAALHAECAANPGAEFLSFATAHFSSSDWRCVGRRPVITRTYPLDRRGFFKASWVAYVVDRNGVIAPIKMPEGLR